jgi:hypothetical protein
MKQQIGDAERVGGFLCTQAAHFGRRTRLKFGRTRMTAVGQHRIGIVDVQLGKMTVDCK